jgi:hypothetical protein
LSPGGSKNAYLEFPESLTNVKAQFEGFERGLGVSQPTISHWREDPLALDPYASAQVYFYDAGRAPYPYPNVPPGLTALQYWFFYPLNYYPTFVVPWRILDDPVGSDLVNSDYHEGDWEHITVLIDANGVPRYLWMARHSDEGEAIPWSQVKTEPSNSTHAIIYPALGGHPSYQSCGPHWRPKLFRVVADFVACGAGLFTFSYATTPLVDLDRVGWACWPGHFGIARASFEGANNFDIADPTRLIEVDGPPSPLHQAENKHACQTSPR